jgi:hypothetical protein
VFVQELRSEVRTIGPYQGIQLPIKPKLSEQLRVPKGLEDGAIELIREVHLPLRAVIES